MVAIEFVNGGRHQAVCRTEACPAALNGHQWRGIATYDPSMASGEADVHRRWHRFLNKLGPAVARG